MKNVTVRALIALVACAAVLPFVTGGAPKDKAKGHTKAPIIATAQDGTTWIAGEAKISAAKGILEVSIDMASGVPNARAWITVASKAITYQPELQLFLTDSRGDLKCARAYGINTLEPFEVGVGVSVEGAPVSFGTDKDDPVTVDPKG